MNLQQKNLGDCHIEEILHISIERLLFINRIPPYNFHFLHTHIQN